MPIISKSIVFVYKQMLISTISHNAIPFTTIFSQFFTFLLLSSHLFHATVCIIKSFLCHDIKQAMSYHIMEFYVTTIAASLIHRCLSCTIMVWPHETKLGLDKHRGVGTGPATAGPKFPEPTIKNNIIQLFVIKQIRIFVLQFMLF